MAVAGLGDSALPALLSRAVLSRYQANEGHQPPRGGEAFEVVQLDGEADGADGIEAAEAAQRGDGSGIARVESEMFEVDEQGLDALLELVDGEEVVGEDDRLGGVVEAERLEPAPVNDSPCALAGG